jgi:hypothetical protein
MIIVDYNDIGIKRGLWQYDFGQVLRIQGGNLKSAVEIHFSLQETGGEAVTRIGTTKDGVTDVVIPDTMLINDDIDDKYNIYVFIYIADRESGKTEKKFALEVKSRPKPEAFDATEDKKLFEEAIKAVNESAERAETAEQQAAKHAEQTKLDAQQTTADRQEVKKLVESVSGIGEQVETVKEYKEQAQTAATNALLSEQKSEQAKESAIQAQANAETAEDMAEQHALEVAGDKAEVERLATQVRQDKSSVEQAVQGVGNTAQQAEQSINTAKTKAVEAVNATKTDAVKAVQTEGTKQTEAVQVKGQEVINSIPSDFTTQMATKLDKQQGTENAGKSLIIGEDGTVIVGEPAVQIEVDKTLAQEGQAADAKATGDKILQYAIKNTASGEGIVKITDSAEEKLLDFGMQGKTEQEENPSIESPKEIINAGADGQIEVKVTGKNLFDISKNPYKCDEEKICIPSKCLGEINITNGITFEEKTVYYLSWESYTITKPNSDWSPIFGVKYTDGTNEDFYMHLNKSGFKTNANKTIGYVYIRNPWSVGTEVNRIQIEKGTKRTEYEPFKLQTLTILLDRSLTKWDRIEKRDGVYGITYKHKVVEDFATLVKDSEPIYGNPGEKYFSVKADGATLNYDYSKVYSEVGVYKKDVQRLYVPKVMASSFIVGVNDTDTIETAKAHMHYKVIYETDAEEFVPLPQETQTALNALHTYYPTTVMGNSEDCEMEVEYVADTKNYIDNKISANVASIISQYQTNVANLLSLMPLSVQAGMVENDTNNILENVEEMKHE